MKDEKNIFSGVDFKFLDEKPPDNSGTIALLILCFSVGGIVFLLMNVLTVIANK